MLELTGLRAPRTANRCTQWKLGSQISTSLFSLFFSYFAFQLNGKTRPLSTVTNGKKKALYFSNTCYRYHILQAHISCNIYVVCPMPMVRWPFRITFLEHTKRETNRAIGWQVGRYILYQMTFVFAGCRHEINFIFQNIMDLPKINTVIHCHHL